MATIKLTDQFGLDEDITLADSSALLRYFQQLPSLRLDSPGLAKVGGLTLDQPALTALSLGVSFDKPIPIGAGPVELSIQAGVHGSLALFKHAEGLKDILAEDADVPEGACYVSFGMDASVGVGVETDSGKLTFGVTPGEALTIANYRSFPLRKEVALLDAVRQTVGGYLIPACAADLAALPQGGLATVTGTGSLKLSVTADLLALSNPLASVSLPAPLPALGVTAGGTVTVGASCEIGCRYQVSAHKLDTGKVRLGWYREQSSEVKVSATVSEGVDAAFGSTDMFSAIVGRISADPKTDLHELAQAKLSADEISSIREAVKASVQRKLELALSAQLTEKQSSDAVFLYEIDLAALTAESSAAVEQALRGDLSSLHASSLPGISCVESVWETARTTGISLHVNLLGILNVGSVATLTASGKVMCDLATGVLVITDKVTASRIEDKAVNFGADTQKLRHVMSESFLITAAYHGAERQVGGPSLRFSHCYFDLENQTGLPDMLQMLRTGVALGLLSAGEAETPAGIDDFGRTMVHATTEYDDRLATAVFLDPGGQPLPHDFYERMGRNAVQYLVKDGDQDAVRRRPAIDDPLWKQMKEKGQPGFAGLFPRLPAPLLEDITADYSTIIWWADAMTGAAQRLAAIRQWFAANPSTSIDDAEFQKLRSDLANHLKQVAATTTEEFGKPWGLLAMNEAASRRPGATITIDGPKLVRAKERRLAVVAAQ